jgi:hypothetical protein
MENKPEIIKWSECVKFHDRIIAQNHRFSFEDAFLHLITYYNAFTPDVINDKYSTGEQLSIMWNRLQAVVSKVRSGTHIVCNRYGQDAIVTKKEHKAPTKPYKRAVNKYATDEERKAAQKKQRDEYHLRHPYKKEEVKQKRAEYYRLNQERIKKYQRELYHINKAKANPGLNNPPLQ